jgi:cytochrome c oxidase subunit II
VRRGSIVQLVLFGVVAAAIAGAVAYFVPWLPKPATREADRIAFVFWFVTVICVAIFALVAAVIVYSVLKFRAPPDDDSDGPPIHGHTGLEITWTVIPAILVTAIGILSAVVLARNDAAGKDPLRVDVIAQQFTWTFKYPGSGDLTSAQLRVPLGRSVVLHIHALDVLHSFWVPEFAQKQDAVPGLETTLHITPTRLGTFPVKCAELCGFGHSVMRTSAIVMTPEKFDAWAKGGATAVGGGGAGAGKALFASNGCGACHTLKAAGATAKVGPDLDKLPAEAQRAGKPLDAFIRESIADPNRYVEKGFPPNVMPSFGQTLSKSQIDALVKFLVASSKGRK